MTYNQVLNDEVLRLFASNKNASFLKQKLLNQYANSPNATAFINKSFGELFDHFYQNLSRDYLMYSDPIINPTTTTSAGNSSSGRIYPDRGPAHAPYRPYGNAVNELKAVNDMFLMDRIQFIDEEFIQTRPFEYVRRDDDRTKQHDGYIRKVGDRTGKQASYASAEQSKSKNTAGYPKTHRAVMKNSIGVNSDPNGYSIEEENGGFGSIDGNQSTDVIGDIWRYKHEQTDTATWMYPAPAMTTRDDASGNYWQQREGLKSNGNMNKKQYARASNRNEPVLQVGGFNDGGKEYSDNYDEDISTEAIHMRQFYADPMIQHLNDKILWEGSTCLKNNYNNGMSHGSSVQSITSEIYHKPRNVFRWGNSLNEPARRRNYERDIDETVGGAEFDGMQRGYGDDGTARLSSTADQISISTV